LLCVLSGCASAQGNPPPSETWNKLEHGGYVMILAHAGKAGPSDNAPTPGSGACTARDRLSEDDKQILERLKNEMRRRNVSVGRALTSHDCRCIETAGILFGRALPWSVIDDKRLARTELADQRRAALVEAVSRWDSTDNLSIVTHRATITDAFGTDMMPAELLLIEPLGDEGFRVVDRLSPD
jgi:broad specificity phosphatase PhoE